LDKLRLGRRFSTEMTTLIIGKGAGRGKRAPKVTGRIINLSLGGACIELDQPMRMRGGEEMTVALSLPAELAAKEPKAAPRKPLPKAPVAAARGRASATTKKAPPPPPESRIKCTVAWVDKKCTKAGLQFGRLTDVQRKGLEELLRGSLSA
jgi:hypothetical protein